MACHKYSVAQSESCLRAPHSAYLDGIHFLLPEIPTLATMYHILHDDIPTPAIEEDPALKSAQPQQCSNERRIIRES
jgi:hypothetical protein